MTRTKSGEPKTGVSASVMEPDDDMSAPTQEAIASMAYSYWEARGGKGGSPWEDWFRAEQELMRRKEI
ncbi:MAG TPA: DUF2934 domain-containing protein [Bryobacteraceae bacterium]|jgi:hypothetical protein